MFKNQELYKLVIISLILVTLCLIQGTLLGEIGSWSLLGAKGLMFDLEVIDLSHSFKGLKRLINPTTGEASLEFLLHL